MARLPLGIFEGINQLICQGKMELKEGKLTRIMG